MPDPAKPPGRARYPELEDLVDDHLDDLLDLSSDPELEDDWEVIRWYRLRIMELRRAIT